MFRHGIHDLCRVSLNLSLPRSPPVTKTVIASSGRIGTLRNRGHIPRLARKSGYRRHGGWAWQFAQKHGTILDLVEDCPARRLIHCAGADLVWKLLGCKNRHAFRIAGTSSTSEESQLCRTNSTSKVLFPKTLRVQGPLPHSRSTISPLCSAVPLNATIKSPILWYPGGIVTSSSATMRS